VTARDTADVVVVGGGAVGGWAAYFARELGARKVVLLEREVLGAGATPRSSGIVRAQGGTPETVPLGAWSARFYASQPGKLPVDSGFRQLGYQLLAVTKADERAAHQRMEMQRRVGLPVRWLDPNEAVAINPTLDPGAFRGATYTDVEGCIDPVRNVLAYAIALREVGVDVRERTAFLGLRLRGTRRPRVVGVETAQGIIATERVILTGGPTLRAIGELIGVRIPVGGARHQVVVTEPHPAFSEQQIPMVFDVGAGLYWRPEDGGLLWGMSNPKERPGPARDVDWAYLRRMRNRLARFVPLARDLRIRKVWAATIDYTPDHLPIIGPAIRPDGSILDGTIVAAAAGHGMMWGPAVSKIAADLAVEGSTELTDVSGFGLDRFDDHGRSRATADLVALPFPSVVGDEGTAA
jgi:sarcosine oxidase subunit beta